MKWLKRAGYVLLALVALSIPLYWWALVETHAGSPANYPIDLAEIRRLADSQAGAKPQRIAIETVGHLAAPTTIVFAGGGWATTDLPASSYELVFPDRTMVVDSGFDAAVGKAMGAKTVDAAAFARMSAALARASTILLTHEHPDHLGGLVAQPNLKALLPAVRLTPQQLGEIKATIGSDPYASLHLSPAMFDAARTSDYARYQAIAPGVVLIKAPGHTPGSQMVYVRRADGAEYLLLGDVAWQMRNIENAREKARVVSWLTGEARGAVRDELAALGTLHAAHPELHMMPGHDAAAIAAFAKAGLLTRGF